MSMSKKLKHNANLSLARASISIHSKSRSKKKHKYYPAASMLSEELDMQQTVTAMVGMHPEEDDNDYFKKGRNEP